MELHSGGVLTLTSTDLRVRHARALRLLRPKHQQDWCLIPTYGISRTPSAQSPHPRNPTIMNFLHLDLDVILQILEQVAAICPATLRSLPLVNKALDRATRTLKHRFKVLTFAQIRADEEATRNTELLTSWVNNDDVLRGLRCLTVRTQPGTAYPQATPAEIDHLEKLLSVVGRLRHIHWNAVMAVPLVILEALHKHQPQVHLTIAYWIRPERGLNPNEQTELALAQSRCLTRIYANGLPGHQQWSDATISGALNRIVASAPKLHTVVLLHSAGRCCEACCRGTYQETSEEVIAKNAGFYEGLGRSSSIHTLTAFGDLDEFLKTYEPLIDLSTVTRLTLRSARTHSADFFLRAPEVIRSVRHLVLEMHIRKRLLDAQVQENIDDALATYLNETGPTLESLNLTVKPNTLSLAKIVTHHGSKLQSFELHHREKNRGPPRQSLYIQDIPILKTSAPKLTSLAFDIQRRSLSLAEDLEYYRPFFESVASLNLQKLAIHMDIGLELTDYPDIKATHPLSQAMPPLIFLPPSNTRAWKAFNVPYVAETNETDVESFAETVWRIVFGHGGNSAKSKVFELHFEEWDLWWRIFRGKRINVKEHICVRSLWVAKRTDKDGLEVKVTHVRSLRGRGAEYRVKDSEEFIV
jgi:hypothetical protein